MLGSSTPNRQNDGQERWDRPFISSHRAVSACTRELAHLVNGVTYGVSTLHASGIHEKAVTRQSPGRCIVQLGPVALTITWLRGTLGTIAEGELLVAVWQGSVAPPMRREPERAQAASRVVAPSVIWEEVLAVAAADEASWVWRAPKADVGGYTSLALADTCVAQLRDAYEARRTDV